MPHRCMDALSKFLSSEIVKISLKQAEGDVHFDVSGEGYIKITKDLAIADDIPKSFRNLWFSGR